MEGRQSPRRRLFADPRAILPALPSMDSIKSNSSFGKPVRDRGVQMFCDIALSLHPLIVPFWVINNQLWLLAGKKRSTCKRGARHKWWLIAGCLFGNWGGSFWVTREASIRPSWTIFVKLWVTSPRHQLLVSWLLLVKVFPKMRPILGWNYWCREVGCWVRGDWHITGIENWYRYSLRGVGTSAARIIYDGQFWSRSK
ncbi:hypothetical protein BT69DRAFT_1305939 [Atractiella rhizophila]|nr:hypothetical protein BT69DRAFT_1305939 [Atractiella rhizophila]